MKVKRIIPASLQGKALNQMHMNYMVIEKIRLFACESIYYINMNTDIEGTIKNCPTWT